MIAAMLIFPGILQGNEMAVCIGAFPVKLILADVYKRQALEAEKLVFLTDIEGVFIDPTYKSTLISEMDIHEAKDIICLLYTSRCV